MQEVDVQADYSFAWRWLLPAPPSIVATGSDAFDRFLLGPAGELAEGSTGVAIIDADAWVKDSKRCSLNALISSNCVAICGSPRAVKRLSLAIGKSSCQITDYGLLPPAAPRVVVPLSNRHAALKGLTLHTPGSRRARWAVVVLRQLAAWGFLLPLRRKMLRVIAPTRPQPWILESASLSPASEYALYLGAKGLNRKTVALPIGEFGQSERIYKTAEQPEPKRKLANEASMLRYLSETSSSVHIPALISFHEGRFTSVLAQEYRQVTPSNLLLRQEAALKFLDTLHSAKQMWLPFSDFMARAGADSVLLPMSRQDILQSLKTKAGAMSLPFGIVHGDFAPWNCGMASGKLVVYDWEEGELDGLLLDDAFSYAVLPLILVDHVHEPRLLALKALAFANRLRIAKQIDAAAIKASLAHWSLRRPAGFFPDVFSKLAAEICDAF